MVNFSGRSPADAVKGTPTGGHLSKDDRGFLPTVAAFAKTRWRVNRPNGGRNSGGILEPGAEESTDVSPAVRIVTLFIRHFVPVEKDKENAYKYTKLYDYSDWLCT